MYFIILHYSHILHMFNFWGYVSKLLDLQDDPAKTKVSGSMGTQILGHNKAYIICVYIYVYLHMLISSCIHCIDMAIAIAEISQYQVGKGTADLVIFRIAR